MHSVIKFMPNLTETLEIRSDLQLPSVEEVNVVNQTFL